MTSYVYSDPEGDGHEFIRLLCATGLVGDAEDSVDGTEWRKAPRWAVAIWGHRASMTTLVEANFRDASRTLLRFVSCEESAAAVAWILGAEFAPIGARDTIGTLYRIIGALREAGWPEK